MSSASARRASLAVILPVLILSFIALPGLAADKVWTGAGGTDWDTDGNWNPSGVPTAGQSVLITNANNAVELSASNASLSSLTISNNTLTLKNWSTVLDADDITIQNDGKLALPGSFQETQMSNRIYVVCQNLTVEKGGMIDADGAGFYPWDGPGAGTHTQAHDSGAGYGGRGGFGHRTSGNSRPGYVYGSASMPIDPGSGGGSHPSDRATAGSGGGAIYIDASATITVDGTITADGGDSTDDDSAAGSGGGIYIECATFQGSSNGLIRARGGDANATISAGGGGGGGRIALNYGSLGAQAFVRFSCSPARVDYYNSDTTNLWWCKARMGTLWLPDTQLLGTVLDDQQFMDCRIMGISSWSPASLTVSNCAVTFGTDGFELRVAGDVRVDSDGVLGIGNDWEGTNFNLYCDSLTVTNGGQLWVYSGRTNSAAFDHGALVKVTNDVAIGPSSWIYPVSETRSTNAASARFILGSLTVAKGGGINADARGYEPWNGAGKPQTWRAGAGHGGYGGGNWGGNGTEGGPTYGSVTQPLEPGSGGASYGANSHNPSGGSGGGVIRLDVTNSVTVYGTLTANGANAPGVYGSPGSGGSIYIKCDTFGGDTNGLLIVQGGDMSAIANGHQIGGGGGGRMAVDYQNVAATHTVRFSAAPADYECATELYNVIDEWPRRGQEGTLWVPDTQLLDPVLSEDQFMKVRLFGPTEWSPTTLTVSNCTVTFAEPGFDLDVTGDIVVGSNGVMGVGDEWAGTNYALRGQNDLTVEDGGKLYIFAGGTNAGGKAYGALVRVTNTITVKAGSWIYPHCHGKDGGAVRFAVGDLVLNAGGGIDAFGRGFDSHTGPGVPQSTSTAGAGSGYGGGGGIGTHDSRTHSGRGYPYGNPTMPVLPGSGGGTYASGGHYPMGGHGGGVVWVEADGTVTVDGTVRADGMTSRETYGAGGSGGGIYIECNTLGGASTGLITAKGGGGLNTDHGGGGGGRIALDYGSLAATHDMRLTAACSSDSWAYTHLDNLWHLQPWPGTLSLPDDQLLSETLPNENLAGAVSLWFKNANEWKVQNLTISNGWVGFGQDNFQLTVSNDLTVSSGGTLAIGEYSYGSNTTLAVGDNLLVTNGGSLLVFGGLTNAMGQGDVSAVVEVTNDMFVGAGSWVYPTAHEELGGSPVFRMRNLQIDETGGFNADVKGYRGGEGPGTGEQTASYGHNAGGGYGGKGGDGTNDHPAQAYGPFHLGGEPYGQTNGPALPGSGAGQYTTARSRSAQAGAGGGPVRIEARGSVLVNGTITANGGQVNYSGRYAGGGGSGGGIYVVTTNLSGGFNAVMRANGGDTWHQYDDVGAGGGGRITVWDNVPEHIRTNYLAGGSEPDLIRSGVFADYWGTVSVTNGLSWSGGDPSNAATPGTAFYLYVPPPGTWELTVAGEPGLYGDPSPLSYGVNSGIASNSWITNSVVSPTNETAGKRWIHLGWDLKDYADNSVSSGTSTQADFQLTTNMTLTWHWTNQWLLTLGHEANGTVNSNLLNGWYTNQVVINTITASPSGGYIFDGWEGDFPVGHATDNPLEVTMDQARSITATFAVAIIETNLWTGTGSWDNVANWSEGHEPKSIDHAVLKSGRVVMDTSKYMASLIVSNGATLVCSNWTTAVNVDQSVNVLSNGLITAAGATTNGFMSNRVWIACADLNVEAGGAIDVSAMGFGPWEGPGAGSNGASVVHAGGSYGGRGGSGQSGGQINYQGPTYGSVAQPLILGSGGGSYRYAEPHSQPFRNYAGSGGGAIRIEVSGAVDVDGTIAADGGQATDDYAAAGSGGAIYISCGTLGGSNGIVRARGGTAYAPTGSGGAGGGGRIAVDYNDLAAERTLHFCAGPGAKDWGLADKDERWQYTARMGTLWLPDTNLLASPITDNLFSNCCVYVDGVTSLQMDNLTVSNVSLTFPDNRFELLIDGELVIGADGELGVGGYYDKGSNFLVAVGGDLTLTNGGTLHVYAGDPTGGVSSVGAVVSVTNDIVVGPSSWILPYSAPTNGGTVRLIMEDLTIASGGGINARGRGHRSRQGEGAGSDGGYPTGASHGGKGGLGANLTTPASVYGNVDAPIKPGSGGATYSSNTHWGNGSNGGGAVRVEARGKVTVNGTIDANGAARTPDAYAACGSGGSIYIQCDTFGGSGGLIMADGGSTPDKDNAGPGGGGRIALDYSAVAGTPTVAFSAAGGSNGWALFETDYESRWHHRVQDGTLSLPDKALLTTTLDQSRFRRGVRVYFRDSASWNPASLTVSNCAVTFDQNEFELNVGGDLRVDADGVLSIGNDEEGSNYLVQCSNLLVTNGGALHVSAGMTNNASQTYGTLVTVAQDIAVGPLSWIHPWAQRYNGATVLFEAQNVTVATNGGFNANARGYYGHRGPGRGEIHSGGGAGGGYGGRGGDNDSGNSGGEPYGSTNAPTQPGSSGGTWSGYTDQRSASGGGAVRVDARETLSLYGTITANGASGYSANCGGASGGSIYLFCGKLRSGSDAQLYANGGDGQNNNEGPGGGGRIAIWEGFTEADRAVVAAGGNVPRLLVTNDLAYGYNGHDHVDYGTGYTDPVNHATEGTTRFLKKLPPPGTLIMLR